MLHGTVHPDFAGVAAVLARQLSRQRVGGAAVAVYHRGEPVVDIWGGDRNANGDPWAERTRCLSFSTTKGVASIALHVLAGRGQLDYDAPIAEYWPEFAAEGKGDVTVRQLLCHETGLHRLRGHITNAHEMLDWDHMTQVLATAAPEYVPGTANGYHAVSWGWLVGGLIERVAGKPFTDVIAVELAEPLGLDGCAIGVAPGQRGDLAQLTRAPAMLTAGRRSPAGFNPESGPAALRTSMSLAPEDFADLFWSDDVYDAPIPSANGTFTARSLARMYAAVAGGGELDGVRLFPQATVQAMGEIQNRRRDLVVGLPMHWRLGFHRIVCGPGSSTGFGHWGFGGSGAWCDPTRDLAVAMTLNWIRPGDARMAMISTAASRAANAR